MGDGTFEQDVGRATALLHQLAMELIHVPIDSCTRELHIRALDLKRDVAHWRETRPSTEQRAAVLKELAALHLDAQWWGKRLPSGRDLLAASPMFPRENSK